MVPVGGGHGLEELRHDTSQRLQEDCRARSRLFSESSEKWKNFAGLFRDKVSGIYIRSVCEIILSVY